MEGTVEEKYDGLEMRVQGVLGDAMEAIRKLEDEAGMPLVFKNRVWSSKHRLEVSVERF